MLFTPETSTLRRKLGQARFNAVLDRFPKEQRKKTLGGPVVQALKEECRRIEADDLARAQVLQSERAKREAEEKRIPTGGFAGEGPACYGGAETERESAARGDGRGCRTENKSRARRGGKHTRGVRPAREPRA
jgi:hypothetical protein